MTGNNETPKLLPCPFCGSEYVELMHERIEALAICRDCKISTRKDLPEVCADQWNRRVGVWKRPLLGYSESVKDKPSPSQPEEGKELEFERIVDGIASQFDWSAWGGFAKHGFRSQMVKALVDFAARKDAEIASLVSVDRGVCRACGGDKGHWEGCRGEAELIYENADLKSRIERQAIVLESYKVLDGLSDPDPIKIFGMVEDRLKKAEEASSYWKKQFETASDGIEEMKAHKDAVIASRDALIVEKDKALAWIAENADVEDCTRCEELRNVADDSLALKPSGISSELEMLRTSHKELEADRDAISRAKFSLEADLSLATEGLERLKEELAHYGDYHWPELAEARADLKLSVEYAHHKGNCRSIDDPDDCSCGLSDILKKLRGEKA